jgi:CRISPR/Cas system-associated exonuclease Cas4 (RecB family)
MSADETGRCFDSIESAQDFMKVLADTILDSMKDLSVDQHGAVQDGESRRAQAIELALFKLKTLNCHIHKSRIILNDLRSVRRLILNERQAKPRAMAASGSF